MDDLYTKWKTMWDAKEPTTQMFFLINAIIALIISSKAFTKNSETTTAKRAIILSIGIGYLAIVITGYLQLVPTVSPYQ